MPKMSTVTVTVEYGRQKKASRSVIVASDLEIDDQTLAKKAAQETALVRVKDAFVESYKEACTAAILEERKEAESSGNGGEKHR